MIILRPLRSINTHLCFQTSLSLHYTSFEIQLYLLKRKIGKKTSRFKKFKVLLLSLLCQVHQKTQMRFSIKKMSLKISNLLNELMTLMNHLIRKLQSRTQISSIKISFLIKIWWSLSTTSLNLKIKTKLFHQTAQVLKIKKKILSINI